jgi:hypothetical protein
MLCLESFAWAKERAGETTSNRIEIRCNFFDIENFFFQCLTDGAHPVAFGVSILYFSALLEILFTGQSTEVIKKYHLFIRLSIFTLSLPLFVEDEKGLEQGFHLIYFERSR